MNRYDGGRAKVEAPPLSLVIFNVVAAYVVVCGLTSLFLGPEALLLSGLILLLQVALAGESLDLRHQSVPWLLLLWLVTVWIAAVVGVRNYHANYAPYSSAKNGRFYDGVDAGARTAEFMDAGKIAFKEDAVLDDTLSVGMSIFGGTYCAAPIMSQTAMTAPTAVSAESVAASGIGTKGFVQFWAVGRDCCASRGSFACDSAGMPDARSGVVLREVMEEELGALAHVHKLQHNGFLMAVQAACALHELETTEVPVLMHWVSNPDRVLLGWFTRSLLVWILSSVIYGIVFTVVWYLVEYYFDSDLRIGMEESLTGRRHHEPHYGGAFKRGDIDGFAAVAADGAAKTSVEPGAGAKVFPPPFGGLLGSGPSRSSRRNPRSVSPSPGPAARGLSPTPGGPWPRSPAFNPQATPSRGAPLRGSRAASPAPSRIRY